MTNLLQRKKVATSKYQNKYYIVWDNHHVKMLEKDDKVTVGIFKLYFFTHG